MDVEQIRLIFVHCMELCVLHVALINEASGQWHEGINVTVTDQRFFHFRCFSYIGRAMPNGQDLSIGRYCDEISIVEHEFLHALGFYHEQTRYDRDDHVTIVFENIQQGFIKTFIIIFQFFMCYVKVKLLFHLSTLIIWHAISTLRLKGSVLKWLISYIFEIF